MNISEIKTLQEKIEAKLKMRKILTFAVEDTEKYLTPKMLRLSRDIGALYNLLQSQEMPIINN